MAREIQVLSLCDLCLAEDKREPGQTTEPVTLHGRPYTLDLCETHTKELLTPLLVALEEHGIAAEGTAAGVGSAKGRYECRKCGKAYAYPNALRKHERDLHGITAEGEPPPDPETLPGPPRPPGEFKCDQPGCDKDYTLSLGRRPDIALGQHRVKAHNLPFTRSG